MATNTYVALQTQTLTSSAASVTFSSIPQTYTDLIIVAQIKGTANTYLNLRFNGDTGSNYSRTVLSGNGSTATSERRTNATVINTDYNETIETNFNYVNIMQIMNYSNTNINKTVLCRPNNAASGSGATVGLWRNTAAITSVSLVSNNNSFDSGSTFNLYGIAADVANPTTAKATGGTITYGVEYTYHTFTSSGTFTPNQALTCDYLVVAGGAGGGGWLGGGGGAGGFRSTVDATGGGGALENPLSLSATGYTVTVGAGGAGGPYSNPSTSTQGSDSVFSTITSLGGGRAGGIPATAYSGGSGGGAGGALANNTGAAGTSGQGFAGGNTYVSDYGAAGGGGAGGAGFNTRGGNGSNTGRGGDGGLGVTTTIAGSIATYAGGGGGHGATAGGVGAAGGGNGVSGYTGSPGGSASANTGSGGGGGRDSAGGAGGSGIVIIRYAN
jgi:hypothetical protein